MEEELKCKTQRSPVVPPTQARDLQDTFLFPCPFHASGFLPQRVPCCNEIPTPAPRQTGRLCVQQGTASPQQAVFKQALLCGWFHRSLRCTWARQMTEQNAQSTLKEMGAEGISLSLLLVASAQLWSGGREEMSPIPLNGLLLTPSAACRFPAHGTQRPSHHQKPEESVAQDQGKGQQKWRGLMRRNIISFCCDHCRQNSLWHTISGHLTWLTWQMALSDS